MKHRLQVGLISTQTTLVQSYKCDVNEKIYLRQIVSVQTCIQMDIEIYETIPDSLEIKFSLGIAAPKPYWNIGVAQALDDISKLLKEGNPLPKAICSESGIILADIKIR